MLRHYNTGELVRENFKSSIFSPGKLHSSPFPSSLFHESRVFLGFKLNSVANPAIPPKKSSKNISTGKRNERLPPSISHDSEIKLYRKKRCGGSLPSFFRDLEREGDINENLEPWIGKLSPKEQTVVLKEQRDWRSALRVFRWMKLQRDYVPNVIHYNVVLRILGRAQKWDELRLCWIEMGKDGIFPTNNTYGMLIDVFGKAGLVREAILWLKHMKIRGIFPDEVTMNTVVRILKDTGEFDEAERFFKNWCVGQIELGDLEFDSSALDLGSDIISPKHFLLTELFRAGGWIPPVKVSAVDEDALVRKPRLAATYNTLIDLYGKAGRLRDASDAFAEMLRSGVEPDTFTFNTMINICGSNGLLSEAESLLSKMEERGISPDTKTFNIFLSLYGNIGDIDAVLACYRKIKDVGLSPDTVTYRAILYILSERKMIREVEEVIQEMNKSGESVDEQSLPVVTKMYVNEGLVNQAKNFLEKNSTGKRISSKTYAAIIDSYADKGLWAEAEAVFFENRDIGLKKDVTEYNVMIKAYGKAKLYEKALSLYGTMRSNGIWPDECTYNSLIQMLSGGELIDNARDLLAKMQEAGFKPICKTFSAVLACTVRLERIAEAIDIYEEMMKVGVEPNEFVYGSLIDAFAEDGKVEEALRYFCKMEEAGLTANQVIYTSLIKAYSKVGLWKEAQELYGKMKDLEGGPDVVASNSMIDLYADLGMVNEAKLIFDSLRESGRADGISFATMMYLYKSMGRLDEAIDVAQEMQHSGLLTDCASFTTVMASYAANGQLRECGELLHQMITRRILPDSATFKVIFMMLKKGGTLIEAVNQLEQSYEDGKPFARQAIITSVFSVLGLHALALESCETFTNAKVGLDPSAYNAAIHAYGASGDVDKALNMFMRMQDEGMKPDLVTYIYLVGCYGKAGLVEGVKRIYNQMNNGEIELSESLFKAVIDAYKTVGRQDLAALVSQEMRFSFYWQDRHDWDNEVDESSTELTGG